MGAAIYHIYDGWPMITITGEWLEDDERGAENVGGKREPIVFVAKGATWEIQETTPAERPTTPAFETPSRTRA